MSSSTKFCRHSSFMMYSTIWIEYIFLLFLHINNFNNGEKLCKKSFLLFFPWFSFVSIRIESCNVVCVRVCITNNTVRDINIIPTSSPFWYISRSVSLIPSDSLLLSRIFFVFNYDSIAKTNFNNFIIPHVFQWKQIYLFLFSRKSINQSINKVPFSYHQVHNHSSHFTSKQKKKETFKSITIDWWSYSNWLPTISSIITLLISVFHVCSGFTEFIHFFSLFIYLVITIEWLIKVVWLIGDIKCLIELILIFFLDHHYRHWQQ